MRVRTRCEGCGRGATVDESRADLLYYCERCAVDFTGMSLADVRDHLAMNAPAPSDRLYIDPPARRP